MISGLLATFRRSRTYPNRPLGLARSGPWHPAHLAAKTPRTSAPRSRSAPGVGGCASVAHVRGIGTIARNTSTAIHHFIGHHPSGETGEEDRRSTVAPPALRLTQAWSPRPR